MFGNKIEGLWDKLPSFVRGHMTVRATLRGESDEGQAEPWVTKNIDTANLITSKVDQYPYGVEYHRPLLDIDFDAQLVPSSTPGHYHLYLNRMIPKATYFQLLRDLARAGIIQPGFADSAIERGASTLRLPWIKKDDWAANQLDPEGKTNDLRLKIEELEREAARLREELDKAMTF